MLEGVVDDAEMYNERLRERAKLPPPFSSV